MIRTSRPEARAHVLHRGAVIIGAKGGLLRQITVGDVMELLDAEASAHAKPMAHGPGFYRMLHRMGIFEAAAPQTLRELTASRQRTPAELIDRYDLACRPVRDLLVDYLKERQPALDYSSLRKLSAALAGGFWKDLERHHPGITSLHLPAQVSEAWKQRLRSRQKTIVTGTGAKAAVTVERISYRQCLTPVRAFYLDLAQWAIEEPGRWAAWAVPCPVGAEEINQRKAARHRKSRMDARTRERLPVLPVLVRAIDERRKNAEELLQAARQARPGETFTAAGQTLTRSVTTLPGQREDLGGRSGHGETARSGRGRGPGVLGLGRRGSTAPDRRPRRGTPGDQPPQPGPVPAARHRRARSPAADRPVEDRHRTAPGRQPGTGRRAVGHHPPDPRRHRSGAPRPGIRPARMPVDRPGSAAVPAPVRRRQPQNLRQHDPQHAQRRPGQHRPDRPRRREPAALQSPRLPADLHHRRHHERPAPAHRPDHRRPPGPERDHGIQGRLPRRGDPGPPGVPDPAPRPAAQRGIPRPPPTKNGPSSSAISNSARSPPAPAAARSAPHASTSTAACAAACTGPRPPSGPASPRSATT